MTVSNLFGSASTAALLAGAVAFGSSDLPAIADNFAGGGGASKGIELALGRSPDIAINHNADALALHAVNHPETLHLSKNIYKVDPLDYLAGRHVGLAWFSPDCKHFSKAKGGKPVERNIRDLAWIIVLWAERAKPDVIIMENVEEWQDWGPLVETERGLFPDPDRKGETYQKWCKAMRKHGYKLEKRQLRACDYGAPTIRKRLFVIARRDGQPIVWPDATHGAPDDVDVIAGRKLPWRTAAECIDWTIPCPSIFATKEAIKAELGIQAVRPLADNTMARVARGLKRYVLDAERPFIVNLTAPSLISIAHGDSGGRREYPLTDPHGVVTSGGVSHALVSPTLIQAGYGERKGQAPRALDINAPLGTVVAGGIKHAVITPVLTAAQHGGSVRSVEEPAHTITASRKDQNSVIVPSLAFMAQHNNDGRREGGVNPGRPMTAPLSTITQEGSQQNVVTAFVSRQFGESIGHGIDEPSATITAGGGGKSALVAPYLQAYYGNGDGGEENQPCRTITTKDRHGHVEASISAPPFDAAQADRARQVASFMRAHGFWDEREFVTVTIADDVYVIVDIGMRMLTPRELYTAQGFPPDYEIDRGADGRVFSKSVQVSCVGNSVSPPVARALVAANCSHLIHYQEAAE